MNLFFIVLEAFLYGFAFYLLSRKKEFAIVYLPVLFFVDIVITSTLPAILFYGTVSLVLAALVMRNGAFFQYNIYALLISLYFLILLPKSADLEVIRPYVFGVLWLFMSIPLIEAIYRKHSREAIFRELATSAFLILAIFIANVLVSTVFKYSPFAMYGITSGLLYGNLYAADFNILPIAIFILTLSLMKKKNALYFLTLVIAFTFIMLTLRRSVMGLSAAGLIFAVMLTMAQKNLKKVLVFASITFLLGNIIIANTEFMSLFMERYELRNLEERDLEEEKRFVEYELLYRDMFVYEDYSPWFGYELFNSWGNYGRGILGDRSLHGDITNIAHSSGLLGLALYLLMVFTAFWHAYRASSDKTGLITVMFCSMTFLVYTTTGRYTETGNMMLIFLLLLLPLAREKPELEAAESAEPEKRPAWELNKRVPT